jgi:hypothetical protein
MNMATDFYTATSIGMRVRIITHQLDTHVVHFNTSEINGNVD